MRTWVKRSPRPPTTRQLEVLAFVRKHHATTGTPPTMRQIAQFFEISSLNAVSDHLRALARHRLVWKPTGKGKSYQAVERTAEPPWPICEVSFPIARCDPVGRYLNGGAPTAGIPRNWLAVATSGSEPDQVAVFRVAGLPTAGDGELVKAWLREIGAMS